MAEPAAEQGCPNCVRLLQRLERMEKRIAELEARLAETQARLAETQARLAKAQAELAKARKNSANSSKPPSSDIVKPKPSGSPPKTGGPRKRGAQPGHKKHERQPFDDSQIDVFWDYTWPSCPDCGGAVKLSDSAPRVIQQVELVTTPVVISAHRGQACWCANCRKTH